MRKRGRVGEQTSEEEIVNFIGVCYLGRGTDPKFEISRLGEFM
jgi:hypothetical protein